MPHWLKWVCVDTMKMVNLDRTVWSKPNNNRLEICYMYMLYCTSIWNWTSQPTRGQFKTHHHQYYFPSKRTSVALQSLEIQRKEAQIKFAPYTCEHSEQTTAKMIHNESGRKARGKKFWQYFLKVLSVLIHSLTLKVLCFIAKLCCTQHLGWQTKMTHCSTISVLLPFMKTEHLLLSQYLQIHRDLLFIKR